MADYTHLSLSDVDDAAPGFGMEATLEARFARDALGCERTGISYQRLRPNARLPFGHKHAAQEEVYVVLGGGGRANVGGDVVELRPLDALRVAPETMRTFEAGPDGLELVAFGGPFEGANDAETTPGWWGDRLV